MFFICLAVHPLEPRKGTMDFSPGSVSLPGEGGGNEVMTQSEVIQLPPLQYRREVLPLLLRRTTKRREARIHTTVSTAIIVLNIPTTVITVMP